MMEWVTWILPAFASLMFNYKKKHDFGFEYTTFIEHELYNKLYKLITVYWNVQVLLVEAGGEEGVLSDIPMFFSGLQMTPLDWRYKTEPNGPNACKAMVDTRSNWPRGKVIGGSSVLNAMLYIRGNRKDYDRWAEMGNEGK